MSLSGYSEHLIQSLCETRETLEENHFRLLRAAIEKSERGNPWFIRKNIEYAIRACFSWMDEKMLSDFISKYSISEKESQRVGMIMAGNIPMVGFHDFLCTLLSGNICIAKFSHQDKFLIPAFAKTLTQKFPLLKERIIFKERLSTTFRGKKPSLDKLISTGSDNTARYINYYFRNVSKIIRKNRYSVAILNGSESSDDLSALADDCFLHFGMGCRSVSHFFVPEGYDFPNLIKTFAKYKYFENHTRFHNAYLYQKSVAMMLNQKFHDGEFFIFKEQSCQPSAVGTIRFSFYKNISDAEKEIENQKNKIQCVFKEKFGVSQMPQLDDFADGVDTMKFLVQLRNPPPLVVVM